MSLDVAFRTDGSWLDGAILTEFTYFLVKRNVGTLTLLWCIGVRENRLSRFRTKFVWARQRTPQCEGCG
jgi:hypothetical protein